MPGENRSSQNLLRKDVFPTAELPTNTILKSRSGVEGQPSSCGWRTVWQLLAWSRAPAPPTTCPPPIPTVSRGQWEPGRHTSSREAARPRMQVALGSGHQQEEEGPSFTQFVVSAYCVAGPETRGPGGGLVCGGVKEAGTSTTVSAHVPSALGAGWSPGPTRQTLSSDVKAEIV